MELLHHQKKILFVGYPYDCRLIERELVGDVEKEFKLVGTAPHSDLKKIDGLKGDIILFDLINVYRGYGPELVAKIVRYYRHFWQNAFENGKAEKVVILFFFTPKGQEKEKGYQYPYALIATKGKERPTVGIVLDKSWFSSIDGENQVRLPFETIWDYIDYQVKVIGKEVVPLEKLTSSARDYALVLRQIAHMEKEL